MNDSPILAWTTESRFGCKNPIRTGDLLVTRSKMRSGNRSFPIGMPCIAIGPAEDRVNRDEFGCISVLIDGMIEDMYPGNLEFPNEAR